MAEREKFETVDEYIGTFPENVQLILQEIRNVMKENAPDAEELISYQIPAFKYYGMLIYYSAYQKHVSVSTAPFKVFEVFEKELSPYKRSKSTVQFPLDQPVPYQLIGEMTRFRVQENREIAEIKSEEKKK